MNTDSFTDEQLLNLINSTIFDETDYALDMFTGGSIQVTTTHGNKITNYKLHLYFGYNDKRNPITYSEEVHKDEYYIWSKAIMLKVESLKMDNVGSSIDKLNARMNKNSKNSKGIGNKVVGIGKGSTTSLRTSYEDEKTKPLSFILTKKTSIENTSKDYQEKLKAYITESDKPMAYQDFYDKCVLKDYKYKDFKRAYDSWNKDVAPTRKPKMMIGGVVL